MKSNAVADSFAEKEGIREVVKGEVPEELKKMFVAYARRFYLWDKAANFGPHQSNDCPPAEPEFGDSVFFTRGNHDKEYVLIEKGKVRWPYYNNGSKVLSWEAKPPRKTRKH